MPRAPVAGIEIEYDDVDGGSPAFLLLPGWCASRRAFDRLTPLLAKRHRVLSVDWRGHGGSDDYPRDFGEPALVEDALAVVAAAGGPSTVPVATAHAGWVAIELRRRLGHAKVPALVLIDWIVSEAPLPFLAGLAAMQTDQGWKAARDGLFAMWTEGVTDPAVHAFIRDDMGSYGQAMWARAAREISAAYSRDVSPLRALAALRPMAPTLHVYAQPRDPDYLAFQRGFAADHPWFHVRKLNSASHFPTIEAPDEVARAVLEFAVQVAPGLTESLSSPDGPRRAPN